MRRRKLRTVATVLAGAMAGAGLAGLPATGTAWASTATATVTVTAGTLAFVTAPGDLTWTWDDGGQGAVVSADEPLDVADATGSGAGWSITLTSTTFSNTSGTPTACSSTSPCSLPSDAAGVVTSPTASCDAADVGTCALAADSVSYPYTVPAGTTAPVATSVFDAAAGTGMGDQTATVPFQVTVPAGAYAGSYVSTWTFSLVTGP